MNTTESFIKTQDVIKGIYACHKSTLKLEINSENSSSDSMNVALQRLLHDRKEIAKAFVESKFDSEKQNELVMLFSKYNNEIIQLIGLYTI